MTRKQILLVGLLMLLSFVASSLLDRKVFAEPELIQQTVQPVYTSTPKWEYKVIFIYNGVVGSASIEGEINKWADQGFELAEFVAFERAYYGSEYKYVIMKRQKK